jgi:hypothetical protein
MTSEKKNERIRQWGRRALISIDVLYNIDRGLWLPNGSGARLGRRLPDRGQRLSSTTTLSIPQYLLPACLISHLLPLPYLLK